MTAIAYREGLLVADSAVYTAGVAIGTKKKIARGPDGTLGAAAGVSACCSAFCAWIESGMPDAFRAVGSDGDFLGITVYPDGRVLYHNGDCDSYQVDAPFHAIGFPADMMVGAMAAGATARQAVEIACSYSDSCGGKIQVEYLDPSWPMPLTFDQMCEAFHLGFSSVDTAGAVVLTDPCDEPPSEHHPFFASMYDAGQDVLAETVRGLSFSLGARSAAALAVQCHEAEGAYYHPAVCGEPGSRVGRVLDGKGKQREIDGVTFTVLVPAASDAPAGSVASLGYLFGAFPRSKVH